MSRPRLALTRWPLRRAAAGAFAALVLAFSATAVITHPGTSPAAGGTHVWTGGGTFPVFDDVASWDVGTVPGVGADLVFTGSPSAVTPNNDLSGLAVNSLTFDAAATAAFTITGNPITLEATTGTLTNLSANLQTINAPLNLTNAVIAGGSGGLLLIGALTGSASQTGGTVSITSAGALAYTVGSGATLQTDAATAWASQDVTVSSGGTLVPNPGGIGALTGIDQVTIAGTLQTSLTASASDAITAVDTTLSGPLAVSLTGTPTAGQLFTLITTTSSNPVSGTFSGLPQGATLTAGGETFTISYLGGSGNDVVLIAGEVPGLPANAEATPGHLSASVSFDTPTSTAGAIDQYEVTATPSVGSPWTVTGASSPINVTGLVLGQDYTFTVRAHNAAGWGASSNPSSAIQPDSRPDAPSITLATPGNQQVTVDFTPAAANGGTPVTGYTVTATPSAGSPITASGSASPITVTGLDNGTAYDFTVHATNDAGNSPASSPVAATPRTAPGAPTVGTATAGNGSASVTFTAGSTGGATVTSYEVTSSPGGFTATGASSPIVVGGLANGTPYTFTVKAFNAAGWGDASAASNSVTPGGQVRTWIGGTGNNFSTAANWAGGIAPLAGDLVHLGGAGGSVVVDVADTHVGSLTFDSGAGAFSISGNRLFVDGNMTNLSSSDHVVVAHLGISAATTIDTGSRTITINGDVNGAGSIVKAGSGTLLVTASSNAFTGPVTVQAGTLETDADANVPALTVASTGTLLVGGTGAAGTLTVSGALDIASTLVVDVTGDTTGDRIVVTGTVTLSGGLALGTATVGAPASALDLITNDGSDAVSGTFTGVGEGVLQPTVSPKYRVTYVGGTGNDLQLVHVAAPTAPTGVTAVPFDRSAQVSFPMAPTGLPTTYTVTASPGGASAVGTSPVTVTGLTNGVAYTFTVTAHNDLGDAPSSPTSAVTPVAKPTAPTGAAAVAGDGSATITFGAAADNGSPISSYTVVASPGGATASGAGSPIVMGGLANGTAYTFTVRATNANGDGPDSSTTNAVVPAGVPFAPTGVTATPSSGQVRLTWGAAAGNGTAVTAYRISVQPTGRTITVTSGTSVRFVGLTNGTTYTYSVKAVNAVGDGVASADVTATPAAVGTGYWMLEANGAVHVFGSATDLGGVAGQLGFGATAADLEPTPNGRGYWIVDSLGKVTALGEAPALGSADTGAFQSGERVASISSSASGNGYWLFTNRGRVQAFGDAPFLGDVSSLSLNGGVVGSIPTPSGLGYYMVASDGGIFAFGDAGFFGSMGGAHLNAPVNGLVPDPDGTGYWLVASDGGIFAFDAGFHGSMGAVSLNRAVVGMVRFGTGYLMVGADGGVFNFSDQQYFGSLGANPPANPIVGIAVLEQ